jgi:hypothetical protein
MKTTLNQIRECNPCAEGWTKLLQHLNKTKADDEPLSLLTVLDSNGFDDALWCLRAVKGYDKEKRLYAVWCARQVQHLMPDKRSVKALDVAERYANGEASDEELKIARDDAAYVAEYTDSDAAYAVYYTLYYDLSDAYTSIHYAAFDARDAMYAACDAMSNTVCAARYYEYDAAILKQEAEFRRLLLSLE